MGPSCGCNHPPLPSRGNAFPAPPGAPPSVSSSGPRAHARPAGRGQSVGLEPEQQQPAALAPHVRPQLLDFLPLLLLFLLLLIIIISIIFLSTLAQVLGRTPDNAAFWMNLAFQFRAAHAATQTRCTPHDWLLSWAQLYTTTTAGHEQPD